MSVRTVSLVLPVALALSFATLPVLAQDPELGDTAPTGAESKSGRKKGSKKAVDAPAPETSSAEGTDVNGWGAAATAEANAAAAAQSSSGGDWERPDSDGESESDDKGDSDHEKVVGRFSFGLLGLAELPVGVADPANANAGTRAIDSTITAPVLGSRYWFSKRIGLELGVGFMIRSGTIKQTGGSANDGAKATAFAGQLGLPISALNGKHYNLLFIPYVGFGTSSATDTRGSATNADDVFGKGTLIEGGLRMGVEVQLGAIGLEGFALQVAGGVRMRVEKRNANVPIINAQGVVTGEYDLDNDTTTFTTSPGSTLGSAIAGTLAALYYF